MRLLTVVVSLLISTFVLVHCDESSQSILTETHASDLRRRYRRKLQNGGDAGGGGAAAGGAPGEGGDAGGKDAGGGDAGGDAGGKDAGGGDAGGKDAGGGDAGGDAGGKDGGGGDAIGPDSGHDNGPDGGHDNGPDNGHDNNHDNKDDHGCHAPDYHGCSPPTPMPSPYQAHPSYRYPTPLPTPVATTLGVEDASVKEGLFSSGNYAEDAEIGLVVGAALAVCAILLCVAYVFYKAKMHVGVVRQWRESIAQRGGDGTSTMEIALAMMEGENTSLFSQSFDESSGWSERVSSDQYGTAIDVSLRDSSRGSASAHYGPASGVPRGRPVPSRGQQGPSGGANMDTSSSRVHVHDSYSTTAIPPGRGGMVPSHVSASATGGIGGSRHGYDAGGGRPPPRYGSGGSRAKTPGSGGYTGYGRLAPDV